MDRLFEFLRVSDQYLLEDVKFECEKRLASLISKENVEELLALSETFNAENLKDYCVWYKNKKSRR